MSDMWWREALCPEVGMDAFFDEGSRDVAIDTCRMCPVRVDCLVDALAAHSEYGIFGGFGRYERRALIKHVEDGADPAHVAETAIRQEGRADATNRWRWAA